MGDATPDRTPAVHSAPQSNPQASNDGRGGILSSYLRTVLQGYITKSVARPVPTPPSSPARSPVVPVSSPLHPLAPQLPPASRAPKTVRLGDFNSKWNWLKGCRKAARLGKGLGSQPGESALLLQCEHWLEATDPKHRYGNHLRPYYTRWISQKAPSADALPLGEDFFYWLDEGHGRTVDLEDVGVPREMLESGRVQYLTYEERERCEVVVGVDGLLQYKRSGRLVHTHDVEETVDDIHMHPAPSTPTIKGAAVTPADDAATMLSSSISCPERPQAPPQPLQQLRMRRTASAPGDNGPMDGGSTDDDSAATEAQREPLAKDAASMGIFSSSPPHGAAQGSVLPVPETTLRALPAALPSGVLASNHDPTAAPAAAAAEAATADTPPQARGGRAAEPGPLEKTRSMSRHRWLKGDAPRAPGKKEKCGWIYVMDTSCRIYIHRKQRGQFHHSSFLSGAAVLAAGGLEVRNGRIEKLSAHSGHYRPDEATFQAFVEYLKEQGADLRLTRILGVSLKGSGMGAAAAGGAAAAAAQQVARDARTVLLMRRNSV